MKKKLALFLLTFLLLTSCNENIQIEEEISEPSSDIDISQFQEEAPEELKEPEPQWQAPQGPYAMFSINVQNFIYPEESIKVLNRFIDIHEQYNIDVDIYVTDASFQNYVNLSPELIDRFKNSKNVAISYHVRPPTEWYKGFDQSGLRNMSANDIYDFVYERETHAINMETGEPENAPGGIAYIKEVLGYAPIIAGTVSSGTLAKAVSQVYSDLGVIFDVQHKREIQFGEVSNSLYLRPETVEIKGYEYVRAGIDGEQLYAEQALPHLDGQGMEVVNMKWHDSDVNLTKAIYTTLYYEDGDRSKPLSPPYDLSKVNEIDIEPSFMQDKHWVLYESAVKYIAENPDWISINAIDLAQLLPE